MQKSVEAALKDTFRVPSYTTDQLVLNTSKRQTASWPKEPTACKLLKSPC